MAMNLSSETIRSSMKEQCNRRGYAAPVDVLLDLGVLDKKKLENWQFGKVEYLERVCNVNLHKLSEIMKIIRTCAKELNLQPSFSDYRQWGAKNHKLRFSKSGDPGIEKNYATHYCVKKAERQNSAENATS